MKPRTKSAATAAPTARSRRSREFMDADEEIIGLFDTYYMHSVCDYVGDSASQVLMGRWAELAQSLRMRVHAPMDRYILRLLNTNRGVNAVEFEAADRFRTCAENCAKLLALAGGDNLLDRQSVTELSEDLRAAWTTFIAHGAAHRIYDDLPNEQRQEAARSKVNRDNARRPRQKSLTRQKVERFREEFLAKHRCLRGWVKAASLEFDVDAKTIRKRLAVLPATE